MVQGLLLAETMITNLFIEYTLPIVFSYCKKKKLLCAFE